MTIVILLAFFLCSFLLTFSPPFNRFKISESQTNSPIFVLFCFFFCKTLLPVLKKKIWSFLSLPLWPPVLLLLLLSHSLSPSLSHCSLLPLYFNSTHAHQVIHLITIQVHVCMWSVYKVFSLFFYSFAPNSYSQPFHFLIAKDKDCLFALSLFLTHTHTYTECVYRSMVDSFTYGSLYSSILSISALIVSPTRALLKVSR